jgi:hypothetical protein
VPIRLPRVWNVDGAIAERNMVDDGAGDGDGDMDMVVSLGVRMGEPGSPGEKPPSPEKRSERFGRLPKSERTRTCESGSKWRSLATDTSLLSNLCRPLDEAGSNSCRALASLI